MNVPIKFSHIFFKKKTPSIIRTKDTKFGPQSVNSYKLHFFISATCGDQVNPESRSGESARGESRLAAELCKVISKAQWPHGV